MNSNQYGEWGGTDGGNLGSTTQDRGFVHNEYKRHFDGNGTYPNLFWCTANINHTHNYDHKHDIPADGGTEARPDNYTIRVWKRTA